MLYAPTTFHGSVAELYSQCIEPLLPRPEQVGQFHAWMAQYCVEDGSVFPIRAVRGTARRRVYSTLDGTAFAPADNSPAWVVHALLVSERVASYAEFRKLMLRMPVHMFDIRRIVRQTANDYGWYVAHVIPAKNRDTDFERWSRAEVERRYYLTLHPCNLFFVPGVRNRELGEHPRVIRFLTLKYAERYGPIWKEFLDRVGPIDTAEAASSGPGDMVVHYRSGTTDVRPTSGPLPTSSDLVKVRYKSSRLMFKRDDIEPLRPGELFEVVTPTGVYRFSKDEFYSVFPSIPNTASYRQSGAYHGAKLHLRAQRFRVTL
jgi:hypothetical protein